MTDTRLRSAHAKASAWVVDTRALGLGKRQGPGTSRPLSLVAPALEQTGTGVLSVPAGSDVHVTGRLEAVAEGVLVSGTARATAVGSCARCLRDISVPVAADVRELYAYPDSTTAATTEDDEVPRLVDEAIDLEPLVHDELVLAMPLAPVCSPDCQGLCPGCGERLDALPPEHRHDTLDPRWAALAGLLEGDTAPGGQAVTGTDSDTPSVTDADDIEEN
jgi:uncharacterized protein